MNLPNKLTVLRIIMVPFFVFFMLTDTGGAANKWIALVLFCIASLTDLLDGKIARKYNLVTNFGKFMDPLADKLLVCSAMICMIESGQLSAAFVIIIIAREFIISGFRLVASDNGVVIAASYWGKFKTVSQMAMVILLIADFGGAFDLVCEALIWISLALTIISLVDYVAKNRQVLTQGGMSEGSRESTRDTGGAGGPPSEGEKSADHRGRILYRRYDCRGAGQCGRRLRRIRRILCDLFQRGQAAPGGGSDGNAGAVRRGQ